jgi:HD superfamily phosphohydrolase YqeK
MEPGLQAHAREVADLAGALARALGLDRRARDNVARAAELHDIGKLAIPPRSSPSAVRSSPPSARCCAATRWSARR